MTYPSTIPAFRSALLAYVPPEAHSSVIEGAQMDRSAVLQAIQVFEALKDDAELDNDGLALLLGAAHLIAANGWHGLAGAAVTIVAQRAGEYVAPDPIEEPI
jgi:hypothetical protein